MRTHSDKEEEGIRVLKNVPISFLKLGSLSHSNFRICNPYMHQGFDHYKFKKWFDASRRQIISWTDFSSTNADFWMENYIPYSFPIRYASYLNYRHKISLNCLGFNGLMINWPPNHIIRLTIMSKIPLLVPCRHCKDTIVNPGTKIDDFGAWVDYIVVTVRKSGVQCIMFMYCRIDNRTKYELKNKFLALQLFSWVNVRNTEPSIH